MTIQPEQTIFTRPHQSANPKFAQTMRPNVAEHYWGYRIAPNQHVIGVTALLRGAAGVLTVASFLAALGVWLLPASVFAGDPFLLKGLASILLTCIGAMLKTFVSYSTVVRVHVDTTSGEISEVVTGLFGSEIVLACHGMDAVEQIEIVASKIDPTYGQIQIGVRNAGRFPAGDGALVALTGLRNRLADDCGVDRTGSRQAAIWSGPLSK